MKKYFLFLFIMLISFSKGIKAEKLDIKEYEKEVLNSFYCGDYYKLYESIEKLIVKNPTHPLSTLFYEDFIHLTDVHGSEKIETTLNNLINIIKNKNIKNKNAYLLLLKLKLEKLLYQVNNEKGRRITEELSPIRKWEIIGPYNKYGTGDIEYPFLPEIISDKKRSSFNRKKINLDNYDGMLDLSRYLNPNSGIAYATASFHVDGPIKIRIFSDSYYKVFINGKEVIKNIKENYSKLKIVKVWETGKISLMVKLYNNSSWKLRVILTDDNDAVLKPKILFNRLYVYNFKHTELHEFPYEYLIKEVEQNRAEGYTHLASYFNEFDSDEAVVYYKKSISLEKNPVISYLLASTMIDHSKGHKGTAYYLEGWSILNDLYKTNNDFIPVMHKKFLSYIYNRDYFTAYNSGKKIIALTPKHLLTQMDFLNLLNSLGYEKEFDQSINIFKKEFPNSVYPLIEEFRFYKKKDINKSISIGLELLQKRYIKQIVTEVANEYKAKGDYDKTIKLLQKYNYNHDFTNELIDIYFIKGDYKKIKELIFKEVVNKDKPTLYFTLGLIDYIDNIDPMMYWQKMLLMSPSSFNAKDYINYLNDQKLKNPFKKYIDGTKVIDSSWMKKGDPKYPSTAIYRSRIFELYKDGGSRIFCEDIIYVNNQKGIDAWGDFKISYRGTLYPVRVRVYHKDGHFNESYRIQKIDRDNYININSLKKSSILHVSYIVDNPITTPRQSYLFSLPFLPAQKYDEPVLDLSVKVIVPGQMNVNFFIKDLLPVKMNDLGNKKIYSINAQNLSPVHIESFSGSSLNNLPFFSFSTMNDLNDFINWYNGIILDKAVLKLTPDMEGLLQSLKAENNEETIKNVYNYVSREIDLQKNILFYPEQVNDILYKKRGTVEDKVILAKAFLDNLGIISYIALAKNNYSPEYGEFISPDIFSTVLLFIPIDVNKDLWLDFSNQYYSCGTVDGSISESQAYVLLKNNYEIKKIHGSSSNKKISRYVINLNSNGDAECDITAVFKGRYGQIRKHFKNKQYHEDIINIYFGNIIPALNIETFQIENYKNYYKPFTIKFKGSGLGIALVGVNKMVLQPIMNKCIIYEYIRYPQRKHPLIISSPIHEEEEYVYNLPVEYKNELINNNYTLTSKFGSATIGIIKMKDSNSLKVTKKIDIKSSKINPLEYDEFLKFCLDLKKLEYKNVVLKIN